MTVFGFGRLASTDYQSADAVPQHFTFGLMDTTAYENGAPIVRSAYQPLLVTLGPSRH